MNIFSNAIPKERFVKGLKELSHINFSIFNEYRPSIQELSLSPINILIVSEPDEYFGNLTYAIQHRDYFSFILTCHREVVEMCENALFCPYGESWWEDIPYQYEEVEKEFKTSFLRGNKLQSFGHSIRHQIYNRRGEIKTPIQFWDTLNMSTIHEVNRENKVKSFHQYMFSLCIENTAHPGYFTEKITDCILYKTIPVYWGCPDIENYYDPRGMFRFTTADEAIELLSSLTQEDYYSRLEYVEDNYKKAFEYKDYIHTIKNQIKQVFNHNNIA